MATVVTAVTAPVDHESAGAAATPAQPPRPSRRRRVARSAVFLLLLAIALLVLWPARFGGHLGITQVSGHSMDGTYSSGDLLLSWQHDAYGSGDVVVYQPPGIDTEVLVVHRIVGSTPEGTYVTRGDNKDDVDPWNPRAGDVVGSVFLQLPTGSIPGFANLRGMALILLVALFAAWAAATFALAWTRPDDDPADPADPAERASEGVEPGSPVRVVARS